MYLAVVATIAGQALLLGQPVLLLHAAAVAIAVAAFVRWSEQPALSRQFGATYEAYRRAVPAWLPRVRAYRPGERAGSRHLVPDVGSAPVADGGASCFLPQARLEARRGALAEWNRGDCRRGRAPHHPNVSQRRSSRRVELRAWPGTPDAPEQAMANTPLPVADRRVRGAVDADVVHAALDDGPVHGDRVRQLGREIHGDALIEAQREHRHRRYRPALARALQVVNYLFGALYAIIALEIALEAFGARDSNGFKHLLDQLSGPFLAPFRTLLPIMTSDASQFIPGYLVALVVYFLIHLGLRKIIVMIAQPRPSI
jgi:uncharacterized protein YggT (Ycf19 family)